jgi:peptide/nickel transport system substrate-binding protein
MIARAFKLRFRRRLRLQKLQVEEFGQQAEQQLERNFFKRLERLAGVRRFVITWLVLLVLVAGCVVAQMRGLRAYYQTTQAVAGGTYTEGVLGAFTNASPLYATSPVDVAVSKLLFASLFTYNQQNELVGDLAQGYSLDARGTTYTVQLKPNLRWHDGAKLTAQDVVFTYQLLQNPDARSPFNSSWRGIKVAAANDTTITFTLPSQLAAFPYSLTNGIVPQHILGDKNPNSLRTLTFNSSQPIGAGPFKLNGLEVNGVSSETREEYVVLEPYANYHAGAPKLDRFIVRSFRSPERLTQAFKAQEVNAMVGFTQLPGDLAKDKSVQVYNLPFTAEVMTFFKTSEGVLSSTRVRQALVRAADVPAIIENLGYPTTPVRTPLLQGQPGYTASFAQPGYNVAEANALLDAEGWQKGDDGVRRKANLPLTFRLHVQEGSEYAQVALQLKQQWAVVGVKVEIVTEQSIYFQTTLNSHAYDALLHGISIGKDPDVFVYWDSKNADEGATNRLNFSEYKSPLADSALQAGRTRTDTALRSVKYQPFLQAWQADAPALGLYQPRFLYITRTPVYGLSEKPINSEVERFRNVNNWMIRTAGVSQSK